MPTKTVALTVEAQMSTAYVSKTTTVTRAVFLWRTASVSKQVFAVNATCRMRIANATCAWGAASLTRSVPAVSTTLTTLTTTRKTTTFRL